MKTVALIPARSGSKRLPDKNIRLLNGHPLLAYTVSSALESGVFDKVVFSTDSEQYGAIAAHYGADIPFIRPSSIAGDVSPDIEWVTHALNWLEESGESYDCFSILRPTSPFRLPETIQRAWKAFQSDSDIDSLRAVEKCGQHPCKMWKLDGDLMTPIIDCGDNPPGHSRQYADLPEVYVQNASLEIAWTRVALEQGSIAGTTVMPFFTKDFEGLDINSEQDFIYAEMMIEQGRTRLPDVHCTPWSGIAS